MQKPQLERYPYDKQEKRGGDIDRNIDVIHVMKHMDDIDASDMTTGQTGQMQMSLQVSI